MSARQQENALRLDAADHTELFAFCRVVIFEFAAHHFLANELAKIQAAPKFSHHALAMTLQYYKLHNQATLTSSEFRTFSWRLSSCGFVNCLKSTPYATCHDSSKSLPEPCARLASDGSHGPCGVAILNSACSIRLALPSASAAASLPPRRKE